MPSRKIDDLQVTITDTGVELAQDGVGVVQVDAGSLLRRRRVPFSGSAVPVPSDDELVRPGRPECFPGGGC